MTESWYLDKVEKVKEKVKNERKRVGMMEEQLDLKDGKELIRAKSELIGLTAKSKFLEQYFLSALLETEGLDIEVTPEESLNLGLNGILTLAIGEQQYTGDLEEALQHSFKIIRVKDQEILNLEEKISVTQEFKQDTLQSLKQENESLINLCEIHKNQVKRCKKENKRHREIIIKLESELSYQSEKLKLLKNISNTQNSRIESLCAEIDKKNSDFDSLEKFIEKVDNESLKKSGTTESSLNPEKYSSIILNLRAENQKLSSQLVEMQEKFELKWEHEHYLYEKTKCELKKMKEKVENLQQEVFQLEEEKKEVLENAEKRLQKVRSETAEVLSGLRSEKRLLQKKVQELKSKDFSCGSEEPRLSLKEEIGEKSELLTGSFSSICEFQDVVKSRFVSEECVQGFKEKAENLEKVLEEMKKELSEKDELIVELKKNLGKSRGQIEERGGRKSILLRMVANPIVLNLFKKG